MTIPATLLRNLVALPGPSDLPDQVWLVFAKFGGAVLGSAISLAYVLPQGKREAAIRFAIGVSAGVVFGPVVGAKMAIYFGVASMLTPVETSLMGSTAASLAAWWALGMLRQFFKSRFSAGHTRR